jgi:hypothetical protein
MPSDIDLVIGLFLQGPIGPRWEGTAVASTLLAQEKSPAVKHEAAVQSADFKSQVLLQKLPKVCVLG